MGQRSQIYVRANKELVIANYYQWNYGERMISRARGIIEWIWEYGDMDDAQKKDRFWFLKEKGLDSYRAKLSRVCDVNFDMRDVALSSDILKEYEEDNDGYGFNEYVFYQQSNNDGKLFIDVSDKGIKYLFSDYDCEKVLDGNAYMRWDNLNCEDWKEYLKEYNDEETIETCEKNIKYIAEHATLMSPEEFTEFLTANYNE